MKSLNIEALIAAAGQSSRMGYPKALMSIHNMPAVSFLAQAFRMEGIFKTTVTLPSSIMLQEALALELASHRAQMEPNHFPELGYAGSIKTVLHLAVNNIDGLIINPVDAPFTTRSLIRAIINLAHIGEEKPKLIVPYHANLPGHPVYVSRVFLRHFAEEKVPPSLRDLLSQNAQCVKKIFWPDPRILLNINNTNELKRIRYTESGAQ